MQKLNYKIGFGFFVLFLWNSCEKIDRLPESGRVVTYVDQYSGLITDTNTLGLFQIYDHTYGNVLGSNRNYSVSGSVNTNYWTASYLNDIPAGEFTFNGHEIFIGMYNRYAQNVMVTDSNFYFGKKVTVKLTGNASLGVNSFERTFYTPEPIDLLEIHSRPYFLKSGTNKLEWNVDPLYNGNVSIKIRYNGSLSNLLNPNMPIESINFFYTVSDNGIFEIPNHIFTQMPVGGKIDVQIGRGTYIVIPNNSKNICVVANTIRTKDFDLKGE